MKIELMIEGKTVAIEAEGAVSVRVADEGGPAGRVREAAREGASREYALFWDSGPVWEAPRGQDGGPAWEAPRGQDGGPAWEAPRMRQGQEAAHGHGHAPGRIGGEADGARGAVTAAMPEAAPAAREERPGHVSPGDLFTELSCLRREIASEASVPPYVVFKDSTLREMAEKRPADMAALRGISGVGAVKLERYGERFLAVIAAIRDAAA